MKRKWGFILRDRIGPLTLMNKQVLKNESANETPGY